MKRDRAKLANDTIRTFQYNTRSNESRAISDTENRVETSDALSLRITRRRKEISDLLPVDLVIEIFIRLPVKTVARLLCLSKFWTSTIRNPCFMKLFLAESCNRPGRLFITAKLPDKDCIFYSSVQTQNPCVATHLMKHPSYKRMIHSSSLDGLFCYVTAYGLEVYNSSTRKSITLPKFLHGSCLVMKHLLGYDPIDNVYKVLCMTGPSTDIPIAFQVLTLGDGSSWKMIENSHLPPPHVPVKSQICINGVVYYEAHATGTEDAVMSFHVRSEKFGGLIKRPSESLIHGSTLFRYEGKLAIMSSLVPSDDGCIAMWVLEDHEWSKKVFDLPDSWTTSSISESSSLPDFHRIINVSEAGEFVLAPFVLRGTVPPNYVVYYDPERHNVRKVYMQGINEKKKHKLLLYHKRVSGFLFHLFFCQRESLMFL